MAKERLVYCRVCGEKISSSVKRCPHCGSKIKKGHGFRNLLLVVIIGGLAYLGYTRVGTGVVVEQIANFVENVAGKSSNSSAEVATESTTPEVTAAATPVVTATPEVTAATTPAATPTPEATTTPEVTAAATAETAGVTPEFKAYMDSYEAFMNDYCDFMETYDEASPDLTMLTEYTSMLAKYADFADKVDDYNEENLSAEDYKYYIDVTARVNKRLIDVAES